MPAERPYETLHEAVEILRRDIHVNGVILRRHRYGRRRLRCRRGASPHPRPAKPDAPKPHDTPITASHTRTRANLIPRKPPLLPYA